MKNADIDMSIPDELLELMDEYSGLIKCRDKAIGSVFFYKRAAFFAKRADTVQRKFWVAVGKIYPETIGVGCIYLRSIGAVRLQSDHDALPAELEKTKRVDEL